MTKSEFDTLIRENLQAQLGPDVFGYTIADTGKIYANYYSREAFNTFLREMQAPPYADFFLAYNDGKGGELEEHRSRYGTLPPKMASVASSSRFCYLALRDGAAALNCGGSILFEHECRIAGIFGNAPQLDACIPASNTYIEVKCHEIFDPHRIVMKEKYHDLVYGADNSFGFSPCPRPDTDSFEIPLSAFGIKKDTSMFDIKQLLCHLLGIASQNQEPAALVYLFFKPETQNPAVQYEIDQLFDLLRIEIHSIFNSAPIAQFCRSHHITLRAVAEKASVMEPLRHENLMILE